jgi:hypothetical protein
VLDGLGTGDKVKDPNSAGAAAAQSG